MKKLVMVLLMLGLLAGCSGADYEGVQDVYATQPLPQPAQMLVSLPPDAVQMDSQEAGSLWMCQDYTASVTTMQAGDLEATLREVTGCEKDQLEVFSWEEAGLTRIECTWVSAGEGGDQVARAVILDDGNYHYALTLQTSAESLGDLREDWQQVISTVTLDIVP